MKKRLSPVFASHYLLRTFILVFCLLLVLVISSCKPRPSAAQSWGGKMTLDKAISKIAKTLVEQGKLKGQPVLISPHDFYERRNLLKLPLSTLIREKMVTEMEHKGARVILPGGDEDRLMILQGSWQTQKDSLALNMKVMKLTSLGPEAISTASAKVPLSEIDEGDLTPNLESWGKYVVRILEDKSQDQWSRTLHIRNLSIHRGRDVTVDHGGYFSVWLRTAMSDSRLFRPMNQQRGIKGISINVIRYRGTRGIDIEPKETGGTSTSLTSDVLQAEAELVGSVFFLKEKKLVSCHVSSVG